MSVDEVARGIIGAKSGSITIVGTSAAGAGAASGGSKGGRGAAFFLVFLVFFLLIMKPVAAAAQQHSKAKTKIHCQICNNEPEEPDAFEPRLP